MEQQTPIPQIPQIKDEAAWRPKMHYFLMFDLWERGGGV